MARSHIPQAIAFRMSLDESLDDGEDTGQPISDDSQVPLNYTGGLDSVTITLAGRTLTDAELQQCREGRRARDACLFREQR